MSGKLLGVVWTQPYRVDARESLKAGEDWLRVKIMNEWTHCIVGERLLSLEKHVLSPVQARAGFGGGNRLLRTSGLWGSVKILLTSE